MPGSKASACRRRSSDTIGGLLNERLGRVPRRGDLVAFADLQVEVLRADARHAHLLQVEHVAKTVTEEFTDSESGAFLPTRPAELVTAGDATQDAQHLAEPATTRRINQTDLA